MNINLMVNRELIRSNFDKLDCDTMLNYRYQILFGRPSSMFGYDISSMEKNNNEIFKVVDNYFRCHGYDELQEFVSLSAAKKNDSGNGSTIVIYVNPKKEILMQFTGDDFTFAYNSQTTDLQSEIEIFLSDFTNKYLKQKDDTKSLYFLSSSKGSYSLKSLEISIREDFDVDKFYNDDFKPVALRIEEFVNSDKSGLVIFHGKQGTGKTSFIRHLIGVSNKKFVYVTQDIFASLVSGTDFSFEIMSNCFKDSVLIIEDCDKILEDRKSNYGNVSKGMNIILNLSDGLLGDVLHTKIICVFNNPLAMIDKSLLRKGRLVEKYEFQDLSLEKTQLLAASLYPLLPQPQVSMSLAEVFNLETENHGSYNPKKPKVGFN